MKTLSILCLAAALLVCAPQTGAGQEPPPEAAPGDLPAGVYRLDPYHSTLVFRVSHLGFSLYTAQFSSFDATIALDPADPELAKLSATIDVASLVLPTPPEGFYDALMGAQWFDVEAHPEMTFESARIEMTGAATAHIEGVLVLRGIARTVTLDATFNGGYPGMAIYDPAARIGFSAKATLSRSDFGMDFGLPPEGSSMGVGDTVEILIESEFNGPPLADANGQ